MGARGRPLRLALGLRCLSLQFTSPSARFCVATFISGSKVLHTLAPWWSGTRRYTYWGSGGGGGKWVPAVFFLSCHKDLGKKTPVSTRPHSAFSIGVRVFFFLEYDFTSTFVVRTSAEYFSRSPFFFGVVLFKFFFGGVVFVFFLRERFLAVCLSFCDKVKDTTVRTVLRAAGAGST